MTHNQQPMPAAWHSAEWFTQAKSSLHRKYSLKSSTTLLICHLMPEHSTYWKIDKLGQYNKMKSSEAWVMSIKLQSSYQRIGCSCTNQTHSFVSKRIICAGITLELRQHRHKGSQSSIQLHFPFKTVQHTWLESMAWASCFDQRWTRSHYPTTVHSAAEHKQVTHSGTSNIYLNLWIQVWMSSLVGSSGSEVKRGARNHTRS